MSYQIVARGKEGSEEDIKVVSAIPGKDGGGGFRLHFPCLSVHVTAPGDNYELEYFAITWSNYHERGCADKPQSNGGPQYGENPGTFKLKRVQMKPEMIHVKSNGRKMTYSNARNPAGMARLDYVEMAVKWNSHYDMTDGWDFGPNHPMERTEEIVADCGSIDGIEAELTKRFGDFAVNILELFVEHELFAKFIQTEAMRIAA
jgi:hypothetical protein